MRVLQGEFCVVRCENEGFILLLDLIAKLVHQLMEMLRILPRGGFIKEEQIRM